jgi:hypothetical protein
MLDREQDLVGDGGGGCHHETRRHRNQARRHDDHDEERAEEECREARHGGADSDGDAGEVDDVLQVEEYLRPPCQSLRAQTDHRESGKSGAHGEHGFDGDRGDPEPMEDQGEDTHGHGRAQSGDAEPVVDDDEVVAGAPGVRSPDRCGLGHLAA